MSQHTLRQLKFILPGGAITYHLNTIHVFVQLLAGSESGWGRTTAYTSLVLGITTISLFIYILLIPLIKGIEPNYRSWREAGVLSSVIPVLTASIVTGWLLLLLSLGQWSYLGYIKGFIGASGLYALAFGLMGLIPAPKTRRD